jgi:hypothetical protein
MIKNPYVPNPLALLNVWVPPAVAAKLMEPVKTRESLPPTHVVNRGSW